MTSRPSSACSTWSRPLPTTTMRLSAPSSSTRSSRCRSNGRLAIGWSTLCVSDRMRAPCPAARITTAKRRCWVISGEQWHGAFPSARAERSPVGVSLVADEADLLDMLALDDAEHPVDGFISSVGVGPQVQFRHKRHPLGEPQFRSQCRLVHDLAVAEDHVGALGPHLLLVPVD